jgi:acyl-CoA synthetase (AMP-forming)/AMP-acid ligase II
MNLVDLLFGNADKHPDLPALVDRHDGRDRTVSYAELARRVAAGSGFLQNLGLRKGQTILVFQPVSIELYEILLSAFHSGLRVMLADPSAGLGFISLCCQRAKPDAFIGPWKAQACRLAVPELRKVKTSIRTGVWLPGTRRWGTSGKSTASIVVPDDHPALITFTSGSTGVPKAAVRTHGFLLAQHRALAKSMDFQPGETDLITLPVFVLANLASGMTSVLADTNLARPGSPDHAAILRQCAAHNVTRCAASPAFFQALSANLPPFRKIFTGGAPVFPDLLRALRTALPDAAIHSVYGSTEAEPIAHLPADECTGETLETTRRGGGLCSGKPAMGIHLKIIRNHSGQPLPSLTATELEAISLPHGQAGEIIVSGEHVLTSYLDVLGDAETKIHSGATIWHRTGDAGWIDSQGRVWLLGRASEKLPPFPPPENIPGEALHYPFAIECALREAFPGNRTAALAFRSKRCLVIETENADIKHFATTLGMDEIIRVEKIPLDRRHNAKTDYPALRSLLEKITYPTPTPP